MNKGGHTTGTWGSGSSWQSGPTKTIRVPIALEAEIMKYARAIDSDIGVSHVNTAEVILKAIESYVEFRKQHHHPNQHSSKPEISSRPWDELRRFQKLVQENPAALNIDDDTCRSHSAKL
ncbi:hypothetical protein [Nostoc sp.]|uniref:hypothetical protein n=1 Tax=Nostoc sp. TaxID=1180 RepID=UPI002FF554EC